MDDPEGDQSTSGCWCHSVSHHVFGLIESQLTHPPTPPYSSDFENKFVCGEIMTYEDLKEYGTEAAVKAVRVPTH